MSIMTSPVNQINIKNNEIWIKSWKEIKHWPELKIDRIENLSIENSLIENSSIGNSSNKVDKKMKTKKWIKRHVNFFKKKIKKKVQWSFTLIMQKFEHNRSRNDAIFQRRNESGKLKFRQIHRCDRCGVICN